MSTTQTAQNPVRDAIWGPNKPKERWEDMWLRGVAAGDFFDAYVPLPELTQQLTVVKSLPMSGNVLIPGCGRGYDVQLFASTGLFDKVIGLELSQTAAEVAREHLAGVPGLNKSKYDILNENFFSYKPPTGGFEIVYDYTFLCALDLSLRGKWADQMRALVNVGGSLVTAMFPLNKPVESGGPPYGLSVELYRELLEGERGGVSGFRAVDGPRPVADAVAHHGRGDGQTAWCRWERVE